MARRDLVVRIIGDSRSLEKSFARSSKSANTFGRSVSRTSSVSRKAFGGMARSIAGVSTALLGGAGLAFALRATFAEVQEAQKVAAQTNAVLKSTGGIAGVSAKDVDKLATSLSNLSGVDDELIASGENVLLTFTNVRNVTGKGNDIFDQATKAALDMSTALGTDLHGLGDHVSGRPAGSGSRDDRPTPGRRPVHEGAGERRSRVWSSRAGRSRRRR